MKGLTAILFLFSIFILIPMFYIISINFATNSTIDVNFMNIIVINIIIALANFIIHIVTKNALEILK
jgi:hypothetical protein